MSDLTLSAGAHATREDGMCLMEAVAYISGEPHSDHPECACPVLAAYGRALNDRMPDDLRSALLADLAPRLVGTRSTPEVERRRAYVVADHAVRMIAPLALDAEGLSEQAAALRTLPQIVDPLTARTASYAAASYAAYAAAAAAAAADAAYAAADAAYAAADYAAAAAAADAAYAAADYAAARAAGAAAAAAYAADPPTVWTAARDALIAAMEVANA